MKKNKKQNTDHFETMLVVSSMLSLNVFESKELVGGGKQVVGGAIGLPRGHECWRLGVGPRRGWGGGGGGG